MSDKADVAVSYDVNNEFFRLWLDRRMNYTGAVFENTDGDDLDAAQLAKLAALYRFGKVSATSRVLDIGCGWGANLEYLTVDRGVREAHGITLSEAQYAEIRRRRLPGATATCVDYCDYIPPVRFDTIMSICMIEHVCTSARRGKRGPARRSHATGTFSAAPGSGAGRAPTLPCNAFCETAPRVSPPISGTSAGSPMRSSPPVSRRREP
jgi:Mycolic acid cyclopropane synthetase